ncbi:MAG: site-2 protease family protein [Chlamydiia bacterium]
MFEFGKSIPVKVTWPFFLVAALIGFLNSMNLVGTLFWILVIFVSVLIHEYGHALVSKMFGQKPRIELIAFGGLTYPEGKTIRGYQEFLVILAGPLASLALCFLGFFIFSLPQVRSSPYAVYPFLFGFVNGFWTILNLLPILPLDGGQLMRVLCQGVFGFRGYKISAIISIFFASCLVVGFFLIGQLFLGIIFMFLLFQGIEIFKQVRNMGESDLSEDVRKDMAQAELFESEHNVAEAEKLYRKVREESKQGFCFTKATQSLAKMASLRQDHTEAYNLLKPIKSNLTLEAKKVLLKASFEQKDYPLTIEMASIVFQEEPGPIEALLAAKAGVMVGETELAVQFLRVALDLGIDKSAIDDASFNPLREDPLFKKVILEK